MPLEQPVVVEANVVRVEKKDGWAEPAGSRLQNSET
jgi:hypothetical protein